MKIKLAFLLTLFILISCKKKDKTRAEPIEYKKKNISSFIKVDSEISGLKFKNNIIHEVNSKFNLFDYDYFYNGAGVAVEDFNNDGLLDIFFTGNQVENKLFFNKGNLKFEDVSAKAKINNNKLWANGVTVVDINNDGWMDIYVSQGGPLLREKRTNCLYINQQDGTFTEEAESYGLNDLGISTQSAFFDFDKDGDLDCIVMNENELYGIDPINFNKAFKNNPSLFAYNTSKLYKNNNGKFKDITKQAGLLKPTFGLGLCVSDLNNDGWLDIYIANDYYIPDAIYINKKNGAFSDATKEQIQQTAFYGMGIDVADINNDNLQDIFVLDMASSDHKRSKTLMASMNVPQFNLLTNTLNYQDQFMFNAFQLNIGNNNYTNISNFLKVNKTDWSWAPLIFDYNNDSKEDIYVTNGYRRYALDNDSRINIAKTKQQYKGNVPLHVKEQLYNTLPSEKLTNILYKNNGNLNLKDVTSLSDLNEPSFSNGAAYADLDNDGDLDLIVNNIDDTAFLFKNTTVENNPEETNYIKIKTIGSTTEDFAKVTIWFNNISKTKEAKRVRGYLSAVEKTLHFGLGNSNKIDSLKVNWLNGKTQKLYNLNANKTIILNIKDALLSTNTNLKTNLWFKPIKKLINYNHSENNFNDFEKEILLPYKQSTQGPILTKGDINNDGLLDIFIGGAKNQPSKLFIQTKTGFKQSNQTIFNTDKQHEDMQALFVDIDNDNDMDLYVTSGGSEFVAHSNALQDRFYLNDGNGNLSRVKNSELDNYPLVGKSVVKIDFDKDGDQDIIVGNRIKPQQYPLFEPSIIFENDNGTLKNVTKTVAPTFEDFGMINKVITTDFNNDGWEDFIVVGEWTHIGIFKNNSGVFEDISKSLNLNNEKGWWFNIVETDINNDGLKDYVVGNVGKNIKYNVTKDKPLYIYADDFDANGTHDVVLSYTYNNMLVPLRGKECSTQQMPFIADKMPTFNQFANASLTDIYGDKINTAFKKEANQFSSILLLNKGSEKFETITLPQVAQIIPAIGMDTFDFNKDGFEDIIIAGNIHETEVETPKLDNPFALILLSNKKDNYIPIMPKQSGLYLKENVKDVDVLKIKDETYIVFGCNNAPLKVFKAN